MASLGHIAVGLAAARFHSASSSGRTTWWPAVLLPALSFLPDLDVVAFFGERPYGSAWGHRGASHSIVAALLVGAAVGLLARLNKWGSFTRVAALVGTVVGSHAVLDMLTNGGGGIMWLWPLSSDRFFAPWNPIPVSPIGLNYISRYGLTVALTELVYFSPLLLYAVWPRRRVPRRQRLGALRTRTGEP